MGWFTGKEPSPMLECGSWGVPFHQNIIITGGPGFSLHFHIICPISGILHDPTILLKSFEHVPTIGRVTRAATQLSQHLSQGCRKRGATLVDWRIWNSHFLDYQGSEYATGPPGFPRFSMFSYVFLWNHHMFPVCNVHWHHLGTALYWNSSHSDYRCEKSWHYCSRSTLLGTWAVFQFQYKDHINIP